MDLESDKITEKLITAVECWSSDMSIAYWQMSFLQILNNATMSRTELKLNKN